MKKLKFKKPNFKKHKNMMMCISNPKRFTAKEARWALGEVERLMKMAAADFYDGNLESVDTLFQIFCMSKDIERSE